MKRFGMLSVVALMVSGSMTSFAQEIESEVPGDNFSLEGALELFKKSASPEEFEKRLNSPDSKVNNLDLNGDGFIDYIRVHDRYEGNVHAFIIQAVVSERESQDVAVIELEKLANGKAVLQIIGDEDVYGIETIIEPTQEVRTYAGTTSSRTVVNVWTWPSVQYVYGPYYAGWMSPWGWYNRPLWWHSWRPIAYYHYHPIWRPYYSYYSICHSRRVVYAHRIYRPYRTTSVFVRDRHHDRIERYRSARNDGNRNGRTRNDDGRSYTQGRRADSDLNRRSSAQREAEVTTSNRSSSRERNVPTDIQRNPAGLKRDDFPNRRTTIAPNNGEVRREVTPPAVNRSRSFESPGAQQRPVSETRSVPTDIKRNSADLNRNVLPAKRSATIDNSREVTPPAVNRNRSFESRDVQRATPNVQQRSAPRSTPNVQQRSAPRSTPNVQQRSAPRSTPNVQQRSAPRSTPNVQQRSSPRSSGSPSVQPRSGATKSGEGRRGRQ